MASLSSAPFMDGSATCATCGKTEAKNYLTEIIQGHQTNIVLCADCLRQRLKATGGFGLPSAEGAQCFYCGGQPLGMSKNSELEMASRQQPFHWTCFRCSQLSLPLMTEAFATIPHDLPPEQQMAALQQIIAEVDERIRALVSSPGIG